MDLKLPKRNGNYMGAGHSHTAGKNERALWIALALTTSILIAEVIGGVVTGSLALISDAAHMFTDAAALAIALAAIRIAKRPADSLRSFGYYRFEILAAAFNALLLFAVAMYIIYEAYRRIQSPAEIQTSGMMAVAIVGLIANLVSMRMLSGGKDDNLNVKGAYLEVWSDLLGSAGVIIGAIVIRFTGWAWVDSVVAVGVGLWVLPRTWVLLKASVNVLLEGVPEEINIGDVKSVLLDVKGVASIHDLHVWSISSGKTSLTVHVVQDSGASHTQILQDIREVLLEKFEIAHITVQCELTACDQTDDEHHFAEGEHAGDGHEHKGHGH
jgi:cobalt-zinc-cadmium efflux system protein